MVLLRHSVPYKSVHDPPPSAIPTVNPRSTIVLQHPDGFDEIRPLITFAPLDNGGLYRQVLLDAAYVLSGCKPGFLASYESPSHPIPTEQEILPPGWYTYTVTDGQGNPENSWEVVHDFEKWTFPHCDFPPLFGPVDPAGAYRLEHWHTVENLADTHLFRDRITPSASNMSQEVRARDGGRCALSSWYDGIALQNAHLVPKECVAWYARNLSRYSGESTGSVNEVPNGLLLRADLHASLDGLSWFIFPKEKRFVAHYMTSRSDAAQVYHNVPLRWQTDTSSYAAFARFAFNVLATASLFCYEEPKRSRSDTQSARVAIVEQSSSSKSGGSSKRPKLSGKTPESKDGKNSQELTFHSVEASELDKVRQEYVKSNPSISAVRSPERMADEYTWRALLDDDDYIRN